MKTNVADEASAKGMVDHAIATYGRVDVLYNNAGIMPEADHSVIDTSVEAWDRVMAVNVRGVFLGCKYAIPQMVDAGLRARSSTSRASSRSSAARTPRTPTPRRRARSSR